MFDDSQSLSRTVEHHRPLVCGICLIVAIVYKLPTYFEMHYIEKPNCTDWARYEIEPTALALNENYK
jgi:hypothetical protein